MSNQKALALLQKYLDGKATFEEKALIDKWYSLPDDIEDGMTASDLNILKERLYQQIAAELNKKEAIIVPFYKRSFFRVAASVAILLLVSIGVFLIYNNNKHTEVAKVEKPNPEKNDVAPGGNKAILTLADGSTIILDNAANGSLTEQGNTKVIKLDDGQLAYNSEGAAGEVVYNTISTPRGGQYQLVLADGSKVWLNAASTLRFPATFSGKERKVELTGEGYFEVAKNAAMPFKVELENGVGAEVLGTHFNVMSYSDDEQVKTTLVEGKVRVLNGENNVMLRPNQQAKFTKSNKSLLIDKDADVNKAIAWKNGLFDFDNDNIVDILRQLSRWYDVQIQYVGNMRLQYYSGSIRRQVNISQVLFMLEQAGGVEFKIKGRNVEVRTK